MTHTERATLIVAIILIVGGIAWELLDRWLDRPPTETDEYCDRLDRELDDELWARHETRPHGNVDREWDWLRESCSDWTWPPR